MLYVGKKRDILAAEEKNESENDVKIEESQKFYI
jgi:hypothetical protein